MFVKRHDSAMHQFSHNQTFGIIVFNKLCRVYGMWHKNKGNFMLEKWGEDFLFIIDKGQASSGTVLTSSL